MRTAFTDLASNAVIHLSALIDWWMHLPWLWALLVSAVLNIVVYFGVSALAERLAQILINRGHAVAISAGITSTQQRKREKKYGLLTCVVLAACSLLCRPLYTSIWPDSLLESFLQFSIFLSYYETYSYFIHRLFHLPPFLKIHSVHHRCRTTTPWSAYCVHPVEAFFIGLSTPIFMMVVPLSLGNALMLHVGGMSFTILIHSNIRLINRHKAFRFIDYFARYHHVHHHLGNRHFGFLANVWDQLLKTHQKH